MEIKMFKKESRPSAGAKLGIDIASVLTMHILGEKYAQGKDNEAAARLSDKFGEVLGEGHPEKNKLVGIAKKEVSQARREGEMQYLVERICSDTLSAMAMQMIRR